MGQVAQADDTEDAAYTLAKRLAETARERDELRAEVSRLQGILNKLQLGEEPTRKQHRSSLEQRAEKAEAELAELKNNGIKSHD